ncbi:MAG: hypothetical protein IJZ23_07715 [Roseburia sp.]|nr:hypothetical protein [Roseburia sp.]
MMYIKAKYPNSNRSYTYRIEEQTFPGELVVAANGAKLIVTDEPVDAGWIMAYGSDKIAVVTKYQYKEEYLIADILHKDTKERRTDGRYPLRIGRTVKKPFLRISIPMYLDYLKNSDGSDYSGKVLTTSCIADLREKDGALEVTTANSIYILKPVEESEDIKDEVI